MGVSCQHHEDIRLDDIGAIEDYVEWSDIHDTTTALGQKLIEIPSKSEQHGLMNHER